MTFKNEIIILCLVTTLIGYLLTEQISGGIIGLFIGAGLSVILIVYKDYTKL